MGWWPGSLAPAQTRTGASLMHCPRCQAENPERAKYCLACAAPLGARCAACGAELPPNARFCVECAQPVDGASPAPPHAVAPVAHVPKHLADRILTSREALQGERKQVTVLF